MSEAKLSNCVRNLRIRRGWSQAELAHRAGLSRAAVSAIEINRLTPSVAAALSLARCLECSVEELFAAPACNVSQLEWAWPPSTDPCRYWQAEVQGTLLVYPVESTLAGEQSHDGLMRAGELHPSRPSEAEKTLVMACCDPAAGLLASEYSCKSGFRLIVLPRSSREGLTLLAKGLVHVAGIHLCTPAHREGNVVAVKNQLGSNYTLLHMADWQEGLAISSHIAATSISSILRSKLSWVGREPGSGARQCLDELLGDRRPPRRLARDHRGVVEAIRCGWADVGVCLQLVSEEAGLRFLPIRRECYDLCFPSTMLHDARLKALISIIRQSAFRQQLGDLPGYDVRRAGELQST